MPFAPAARAVRDVPEPIRHSLSRMAAAAPVMRRRGGHLHALAGLALAASLALATGAHAQADADAEPDVPQNKAADADADRPAPARDGLFDGGATTLDAGAGGYRLEVRAPKRLRELLVRHLDLARFRDQPDIAPVELARLVATAPAQARRLLEPEGHFNAKVEVRREDDPAGGPPTLRVDVEPGPQARVERAQLSMRGPFDTAMRGGDEALQRRWQRLQSRWSLPQGAAFSQRDWTDAKAALLTSLHARGYAAASLADSSAEVDAATNRVRLAVGVDSGPLFRFGEIKVEGLERTPASAALAVRTFESGEIYSERALLDYQEALQKVGLYDGVAVELDLDPAQAERATVIARLREQSLQSAQFSIGYSSNTGPRIGAEHTHRRVFGRDLVATTRLKLGRDERLAALDLLTYPEEGGYRKLLGLHADYLAAGGAVTQTQWIRVGRSRDTQTLDRLSFLEFNRTTVETATERRTDRALWGNSQWVKREVNNLVFPTRGYILGAEGGGGAAFDADNERGPFARVVLQARLYRPLPGNWLGQVRGEVAQVVKRDSLGVPDSLLFRAGGDDSVRGYGYRTLGPVRDGAVVGGAVMATGTVEAMRRFSQDSPRWRDWYGAVFVDAGNAADSWRGFDPALGYGVGVRWRSPIGPLRVDLAYGEKVKAVRLHVNVGATF